jgi:hypothetical protein
MDLVGQTAGYIAGRQPRPKQGGGGGMMSHLNPTQFMGKIPGMGGGGAAGGAGGEAAAGASVEELAPLLLL